MFCTYPLLYSGYVLYGFEEMAQWHAESNTSLSLHLKRWKSSNSIYLIFTQYRIVSPYHCDKGIEVGTGLQPPGNLERVNSVAALRRHSLRAFLICAKVQLS